MRVDSLGLFWSDTSPKIEKKETLLREQGWAQPFPGFWCPAIELEEGSGDVRDICLGLDTAYAYARHDKDKVKREPPEAVWLRPDYLPGLKEAQEFNVPLFTDEELIEASLEYALTFKRHRLIFDIECYGNYFLCAFISVDLGKVVYFELGEGFELNIPKLQWVFEKFTVIGFNSRGYDIPIASMAVHGCSTAAMKSATTAIIEERQRHYHVLRRYKVKTIECDHIDIMEVAPLMASLKIYGGRLGSRKMQDLPFDPNLLLSSEQIDITRFYCINDLATTRDLYVELAKPLQLREQLSGEYGIDLRSKSDAQIAEAVLSSEIEKLNHERCYSPVIEPGTMYRYMAPHFLQFQTPLMQGVLSTICQTPFVVSDKGNIGLPQNLKDLRIQIADAVYKLGIGGLHSQEKKSAHFTDANYFLVDKDVTSYYPSIILNQKLYPKHLGYNFLVVYDTIVKRRIQAKKEKNKTVADSLKITINGSFGKLGSPYSVLYSPDLLIQVTITGQLSLLLLIERLELAGIPVVSANTDGVVIKCPRDKEQLMESICAQWQVDTEFQLEDTYYDCVYSRDVNNYIAVTRKADWEEGYKTEDVVKTKGIFASPGLSKNPQNRICIDAITELLIHGTPLRETIVNCKEPAKFCNVRTVKGGAVKVCEGEENLFLGKAIRWYYAKGNKAELVYATNGNRVPKSHGAQPLMELPDTIPEDIDYDWYEDEAVSIMRNMGYAI